MPAEYLVISSSLRPGSYSQLLGRGLAKELGDAAEHVDLRDYPLPLCDGEAAYGDAHVGVLAAKIKAARVILLATPIYNYDTNAAAKNLIELTGSAWEDKIVGFACAAGGSLSYMSIMALANSLMLDFRCVILPRFVYAISSDFNADRIVNPDVQARLKQLAIAATQLRNT